MLNKSLFTLMLAFLALFAVVLFTIPTRAQDMLGFEGLACDERSQLLDLLERVSKGEKPDKAADEVNAKAGNQLACGFIRTLAVVDQPELITVNGIRVGIVSLTIIPQGTRQWTGRFLDKLTAFVDV